MTTVVEHLTAIRDEHGTLTPELVADLAAAANHPLHAQIYDKAPAEAARAYYVARAGALLRVTFRPEPGKPIDLRAFVAVKGTDSPRSEYVPIGEVALDPIASALLLQQMKRDLTAIKARYENVAGYLDLIHSLLTEQAAS